MKKMKYLVLTLSLLLCITGCASIDYRSCDYHRLPGIYPGVRYGIRGMGGGIFMWHGPEWVYATMSILDLPLSFALDTICLPYDVINNWEEDAEKWRKLVNEAYYHYNAGQFEEAIELTKKSLTISGRKDDVLSLANLAVLYKIIGKDDLAELFFNKFKNQRTTLEENVKDKVNRLTNQVGEIEKQLEKETDMSKKDILSNKLSRKKMEVFSERRSYTKLISFFDALEENIQNGKLTPAPKRP